MERIQKERVINDLKKKMVFLVGPRQAGKTWLAKDIAKGYEASVYLNYDAIDDRQIIQEGSWLPNAELLVLDEIHKMPHWKNYLKGLYDTKPEKLQVLVTGSARLEVFRQAGDSLAGRYFLHHLLPLSLAELKQVGGRAPLSHLLDRGGFPEPLLAEHPVEAERWRKQYIESLLGIDVLEFENVDHIHALKLVFELLRRSVGSPVSYDSIARDVGISSSTVKRYVEILKALYIIFSVHPHSNSIARSLLKSPKLYFFDVGLVNAGKGARFENLVAVSLLKQVYGEQDYLAKSSELKYIRTKDQREVDFALVTDNQVDQLIEVKYSDSNFDPNLQYFCKKYDLSGTQVVCQPKHEFQKGNLTLREAGRFLGELML